MIAYIDERKCPVYAEMCKPLLQCPVQAISRVEDQTAKMGARMVVDAEKCTGCGLCVDLCCGYCIEVR